MINTSFTPAVATPSSQSSRPAADCPQCDPQDRVTLGEDRPYVPTAVKLYDMSPIWGPNPGPFRLPMGVHGLC